MRKQFIVLIHKIVHSTRALSLWNSAFFLAKWSVCSSNRHWTCPISWHCIHHWVFFHFEGNQCRLYNVLATKLSPWLCWLKTQLDFSRPRFVRRNPLFLPVLGLRCIVANPCLIHGYKRCKNAFWLRLNNVKHSFEFVNVSKHDAHLTDSFLKPKGLLKIKTTELCDIPMTSRNLRISNLQSAYTISSIIQLFRLKKLGVQNVRRCLCLCSHNEIL